MGAEIFRLSSALPNSFHQLVLEVDNVTPIVQFCGLSFTHLHMHQADVEPPLLSKESIERNKCGIQKTQVQILAGSQCLVFARYREISSLVY